MYKNINFNDFLDSFSEERKNTFTYSGKKALFEYLENYEEDTGEKIELDIIALCCEYNEYADLAEYNAEYNYNGQHADTLEEVEDKTQVIRIDGENGFLIQVY